ncbi:zinc-binding dehydrogenase [Sorangium sp. So ce131]
MPPLGHVPRSMVAWVIRRDRHGEPITAMQLEVVPTPRIGPDEVLIAVMAAGIDYNGNRTQFRCWGPLRSLDDAAYAEYMSEVRRFGKAIWSITGQKTDVDLVLEHPGESTFPVSCFVVKRGGMVVFCAGTTGYNFTMDARFVWMRQKRIQGSHIATLMQASQAHRLVLEGRIRPVLSETFSWHEIPKAHMKMRQNLHEPGNMAALVQARSPGMRSREG